MEGQNLAKKESTFLTNTRKENKGDEDYMKASRLAGVELEFRGDAYNIYGNKLLDHCAVHLKKVGKHEDKRRFWLAMEVVQFGSMEGFKCPHCKKEILKI